MDIRGPFMRGGRGPPARPLLRGGFPMRGRGMPPGMDGMRPAPPRIVFPDGTRGGMMRPGHPIPFLGRGGVPGPRPRGPPVMLPRPPLIPPLGMGPRGPRGNMPRQILPRTPNMMQHEINEMDLNDFGIHQQSLNGNMKQNQLKGRGIAALRGGYGHGNNRGGSIQRGGHKGPNVLSEGLVLPNNQQIYRGAQKGIIRGGTGVRGSIGGKINNGNIQSNMMNEGSIDDDDDNEERNNQINVKKFTKKAQKPGNKKKLRGNMQQKSVVQSTQVQPQSHVQIQQQQQSPSQQLQQLSSPPQQQSPQPTQPPFQQQQQQIPPLRQPQLNQPQQQPQAQQISQIQSQQINTNTSRGTSNTRGRGNTSNVRPGVGRGVGNSRGGMVRGSIMSMINRGNIPPVSGPPVSSPFSAMTQNAYGGPVIGPPAMIQQQPSTSSSVAIKRGPHMMNTSMNMNKRIRYDHPPQPTSNGYQQFQPPPVSAPPPQLQPQQQPQQSIYSVYESMPPQPEMYAPPPVSGPPASQVYGFVNTYAPQPPPASSVGYPSVSQYGTTVSYSSSPTPCYSTGYTSATPCYDMNMDYSQPITVQPTVSAQSVDCYGYPKSIPTGAPCVTDNYGYSAASYACAPVYDEYTTTAYVDPNTYATPIQDTTYGQGYTTAYTY